MPSLSTIAPPLRISYRSGRDDLVRGFYAPCLGCANLHWWTVSARSEMLRR